MSEPGFITVKGAREHNLKSVSLQIPKKKLVVFTGVSGSGKSSLAFDTLYAEGQRRYVESLSSYARQFLGQMEKPKYDTIRGLSPTISIEQKAASNNPRSTVGTVTEVFTYLRVLYARLGHRPCPSCSADVPPSHDVNGGEIWDDESVNAAGSSAADSVDDGEFFPCPNCGKPVPEIGMANFSFNKPAGACPTCTGLGVVRQPIISRLVDETKSVPELPVDGWIEFQINHYSQILKNSAKYFGFEFDLAKPIKDYTSVERDLLLYGTDSPQFRQHFPNVKPPATNAQGRAPTSRPMRSNHASSSSNPIALSSEYIRLACRTGAKVADPGAPTRWVGESGVTRSGYAPSMSASSRISASYSASEISGRSST